jgi:hypothetical protein
VREADVPFSMRSAGSSQPGKEAAMRLCRTIASLVAIVASWACAGGTSAHAKPGPPSYVGRWMDNPGCRPPYENELKFSTRSMEGDELSCRFDRIRGGSGRWHITMTCHGEGGTERSEVDFLVEGNTMHFRERGNASERFGALKSPNHRSRSVKHAARWPIKGSYNAPAERS